LRQVRRRGYLRLCGHGEQGLDEIRLTSRVIPQRPFDLPLTQHVHRFNALESSFRRVKVPEAPRGPRRLPDEATALFDYVVQTPHAPQLTALRLRRIFSSCEWPDALG
jgi:hypothetical protein